MSYDKDIIILSNIETHWIMILPAVWHDCCIINPPVVTVPAFLFGSFTWLLWHNSVILRQYAYIPFSTQNFSLLRQYDLCTYASNQSGKAMDPSAITNFRNSHPWFHIRHNLTRQLSEQGERSLLDIALSCWHFLDPAPPARQAPLVRFFTSVYPRVFASKSFHKMASVSSQFQPTVFDVNKGMGTPRIVLRGAYWSRIPLEFLAFTVTFCVSIFALVSKCFHRLLKLELHSSRKF